MPRIRSVHPDQWMDEEFVSSSPLARLLSLGLRNVADDNGAFEWKPLKLKMQVLPADNCDMNKLLSELEDSKQVVMYEVNGSKYGLIRNFRKYQRPRKPSFKHPKPPLIPDQFGTDEELNRFQFGTSTELVRNWWGKTPTEGKGKGVGKGEGVGDTQEPLHGEAKVNLATGEIVDFEVGGNS